MDNPCKITYISPRGASQRILLEFETNVRKVSLHITVAKTSDDVDQWLNTHDPKVLGFDIEWKPFFKPNPPNKASLMQLSSDDAVLLIQLFSVKPSPALRNVLMSEHIKKVGVGISGDAAKMREDWDVVVNGLIDIGHGGMSLAKVAFAATQVKLSKKKAICLSNWEDETLSRAQIVYAALDAWVASESYATMQRNAIFLVQ